MLAGAALSACEAPGRQHAPESKVKAPFTLTMVLHNSNAKRIYERHFPEFKEKQSHVDAEWVLSSAIPGKESHEKKIATLIVAGTPPDIFIPWMQPGGAFLARGWAAPIDATAVGFGSVNQVLDQYAWREALDIAKWQGKHYGLPNEISNYCLYINNSLFRKAGLDPDKDWPKTWEEMIEVSKRLTVRDGSGITQRGYRVRVESPHLTWGGHAYQLMGHWLKDDSRKVTIDTPGAIQTLQYWRDWLHVHRLDSPDTAKKDTFREGTLAMTTYGSWYASGVKKNAPEIYSDYSVRPFPRFRNKKFDHGTHNYGYALLVSSQVPPERQKAAWQLSWFLTFDFPAEHLQEGGLLIPTKPFVNSPEFKTFADPPLTVFLEDMKRSTYFPTTPHFEEITDVLNEAFAKAWQDGRAAKDALTEAQRRLSEVVTAG
ncbi:MAG: extracellular solute-binding protein [Chloroflexi bacterium]|nr:extracellular solute-binding protein [Chloroflexota bacterium]